MIYQVFSAFVETFVFYFAGALCIRMGMLKKDNLPDLTRIALEVMMPLLTFCTIVKNFNHENINEFWIMPLLGFLQITFGMFIGLGAMKLMRNKASGRSETFLHLCSINNFLYLPIILLQNLFPEGRHLALLLIMNIGSSTALWTIGVATLAGGDLKKAIRNVFTPNFYAVLVAIPLAFFKIPVPDMLMNAMSSIGDICVPFSLLLIGAALYNIGKKVLHHLSDAFWYSLVRLAVIPLLSVLLLKLLPLSLESFQTLAVVALMPASSNAILLTQRYGGNTEFAGQAILLTTILSAITIPIGVYLLNL